MKTHLSFARPTTQPELLLLTAKTNCEHQAVFLCCTLSPSRSPPKRSMTAPQPLWRDAAVSVEPFSGGVYRFHFHTAKEPLDVCPGAKSKPQEFRLPEGFARL